MNDEASIGEISAALRPLLNMQALIPFCAGLALLAVVAIPLKNVARFLKRNRQWQAENGHDRAERREYEWYWNHGPEKKPREFRARDHEVGN